MRLVSRLFVFASSLFIILYGILAGFFKVEGTFVSSFVAGSSVLHGLDPWLLFKFPVFQKLVDMSGLSGRIVSFVGATPSSIAADALLALPPAMLGRILLTAANVTALVMLVHATAKVAGTSNRTAYIVFLSSSFTLATNFQASEPYIILTLLLVLAFYSYSIGKVAACGAFLGLAFPFSPLFAIPLLLLLLAARWRTLTYFLIVSIAVLGISFSIVGHSTFAYYYQRILPSYLNGVLLNPFSNTFQTAWSFFRILFLQNPTLNPHPLLASHSAYLIATSAFKAFVVVPPSYFFYKGLSRGKPGEALAAATFPLFFLLPLFSPSVLVLLAPAIIVIVQSAVEENRRKLAGSFLALYALACIPFYSFDLDFLKFSNIFMKYEVFLLVVTIYVLYLVFQSRIVPSHMRPFRLVLSAAIVAAVTLTLYAGDSFVQNRSRPSLAPELQTQEPSRLAFSPGIRSGKLAFVTVDSASEFLNLNTGEISAVRNVFGYSSGRSGVNFAVETADLQGQAVYFRTRFSQAFYRGRGASLSPDEDYGSYIRDGAITVLDLDPRYIAPVDSLSFLPYKIIGNTFNGRRNNEIDFLLDSLNSSYAIGSYNLFNHKTTTAPLRFRPSAFCTFGDTAYATEDVADSTILWKLTPNVPPVRLLAVHGNIYDVEIVRNELLLSSDYDRGLQNPTVYRYVGRDSTGTR